MLKIRFVIFFIAVGSFCLNAQKQANFWYFGNQSGIEFTDCDPVSIDDGKMDSFEGCATYSDECGNLMFYTNGGGNPLSNPTNGWREGLIWNRNHEVIYNMTDSEGGNYSATQSALFLPKPGDESILYLFTMADIQSDRGLSLFEIDLTLNNGIGEVSQYSEGIYPNALEALTATQHANGKDYWVVCTDKDSWDFVVILITEDGPQTPVFYASEISPGSTSSRVLKISPDGKLLGLGSGLYNFDNSTGEITFWQSLILMSSYAFTFSPQSRYLYTTTGFFGDLIRYDLEAPDVAASMETLESLFFSLNIGLMQIGPDGNIYYLNQELDFVALGINGLDVIRCPDSPNPTVEKSVFQFPTDPLNEQYTGLPNFADHIFHNLQFDIEINKCTDSLFICPGEAVDLDAGCLNGDFIWSTGENTQTITVSNFGMYSVTVTNFCGEVSSDSIWVNNLESMVTLETDTLFLCKGEEITLQPQTSGDSYFWDSGETEASISVNSEGKFTVIIVEGCHTTVESFQIIFHPDAAIIISGEPENFLCPNDSFLLAANIVNANMLIWSTGETTELIYAKEPGIYTASATDESGCLGEISDSFEIFENENCCMPKYPNAFTPDGDGMNDTFSPIMEGCVFANYDLRIYSRWGDLVFETDNPDLGWDGNLDGKPAASDIFVWVLNYTLDADDAREVTEHGGLTLLR